MLQPRSGKPSKYTSAYFGAAPQPFDEAVVVAEAPTSVHADRDTVISQNIEEVITGKLAALVGVKDLRSSFAEPPRSLNPATVERQMRRGTLAHAAGAAQSTSQPEIREVCVIARAKQQAKERQRSNRADKNGELLQPRTRATANRT